MNVDEIIHEFFQGDETLKVDEVSFKIIEQAYANYIQLWKDWQNEIGDGSWNRAATNKNIEEFGKVYQRLKANRMTDNSTFFSTEYRISVMQAHLEGKTIEASPHKIEDWTTVSSPIWDFHNYHYRVKELSKPSIDWSVVSPLYNYMAKDANGLVYLYTERPMKSRIVDDRQWTDNSGAVSATAFLSLEVGECNWEDSLVIRPGYVED